MSVASKSVLTLTARSSGAVAAARFVGFDGVQAGTASQACLGVADAPAAAGIDYPVVVIGTAVVTAGASVSVGANVSTDNQGRAVPTPGSGTPVILGQALTAAGASGQSILVLLR